MKKVILLLIVLLSFVTCIQAQTYSIGHTTINFVDSSRSNRNIPTEIYYPADVSGDNVPLTTLNNLKFPSLVFGHGFVMTWDAYQNFWNALVPSGYVMAFPKTEGSFSPSHLEYAKDLAFVVDQMNYLGTQSSSIFFNRISPMNAVMGHSMGGGASFLAVPLSSNITTLVNFAPAETNPSAITASASVTIPALIFAGANDCVTPPSSNQLPMYNGLASACKTLINIIGASHCQMANTNTFCSFGESTCSPSPTITRTVQHAILFNYLLPWLDFQLKGNCAQGAYFDSQIVSDTAITYQKNCIQCNVLNYNEMSAQSNQIVLYPNPTKDSITIKGLTLNEYAIKITDGNAKVILQQKFVESCTIDISKFSAGIYYYSVIGSNKEIKNGKFIKK